MILYILAILFQALIIFLIVGIIYKCFWTVIDVVRLFLYYKCGMKSIFTTQELIGHGIIKSNAIEPEVVVLDRDSQTHEEFWDNMNSKLDLQFKKSQTDPDEIYFQGRVKRRR